MVTKTAEMLISDLKGDYLYNAGKEYIVVEDEEEHSEKIPINLLMVSMWLKVVKMTEISACLQINSQALAPSVSYKGTILKLYPIRTSREEGIPENDFPRYSS